VSRDPTRHIMIPISHVLPVIATFTLSVLAGHGTIHASSALAGQALVMQEAPGRDRGCPATRAASVAIPFERVDLGPVGEEQGGDDLLLGPRIFAVITDSTQWPAVWHAAVAPKVVPRGWKGDSIIPPPPVSFGKGALVVVGTRTYGFGPFRLRVTSIRQCRKTGTVIVTTTQTRPKPGVVVDIRSRGFDVVRVLDGRLNDDVIFEARFREEP
jgi:hypothetical protein